MAAQRQVGPGIAKVRHPSPHASREMSLTHADDGLWALLFDNADIVSEGAVDREGEDLVYRGTTSIILSTGVLGRADDPFVSRLAQVASIDPHLRLRAVRIARREAQVRAPSTLEPAHMDVGIRFADGGVRIDVEVDAVVDERAVGMDHVR